mmetsp:Transcript_4259/g.7586  ORF Transcript_4259/g.7586 Transcript_4259/m.7586 type:complete len:257 (+) Transcript_4259:95-865(+)
MALPSFALGNVLLSLRCRSSNSRVMRSTSFASLSCRSLSSDMRPRLSNQPPARCRRRSCWAMMASASSSAYSREMSLSDLPFMPSSSSSSEASASSSKKEGLGRFFLGLDFSSSSSSSSSDSLPDSSRVRLAFSAPSSSLSSSELERLASGFLLDAAAGAGGAAFCLAASSSLSSSEEESSEDESILSRSSSLSSEGRSILPRCIIILPPIILPPLKPMIENFHSIDLNASQTIFVGGTTAVALTVTKKGVRKRVD